MKIESFNNLNKLVSTYCSLGAKATKDEETAIREYGNALFKGAMQEVETGIKKREYAEFSKKFGKLERVLSREGFLALKRERKFYLDRVEHKSLLSPGAPGVLRMLGDSFDPILNKVSTHLGTSEVATLIDMGRMSGNSNFEVSSLELALGPAGTSRAYLTVNTFIKYCQTHPGSFLNLVCKEALLRDANSTFDMINNELRFNDPAKAMNALQKVLKGYLGSDARAEIFFGEGRDRDIDLGKIERHFASLEAKFQNELKESYVEFFHSVITKTYGGNFGISHYQQGSLRNTATLASVIGRFYSDVESRDSLDLHNVYTLSIRNVPRVNLRIIPPELCCLSGLKVLEIEGIPLRDFSHILKLTNLLKLKMVNCGISKLPDLKEFESLTYLDLRNNLLKERPDFSANKNLIAFNLEGNPIQVPSGDTESTSSFSN